jgi:5-oxoprolinase (ATP-hydrolysing) subunit A
VSEPATEPGVDLNSDLGEGFGIWTLGDDDALLDIVTSANVACGFHAGDPNILRRVCELAVSRDVAIGAQVSYRDLAGFGRRSMDVDAASLTNDVIYQIAALDGFARVAGSRVRYVKPHGALYNRAVHDEYQAAAVVAAVVAYDPALPVLGLPGSALLRHAKRAGLSAVTEAFADRGYTAQATLVPRSQPGALLHDPAEVARRMVAMLMTGRLRSVDGMDLAVSARSICLHGDSPGAVAMAVAVRRALAEAGVELRPFAP